MTEHRNVMDYRIYTVVCRDCHKYEEYVMRKTAEKQRACKFCDSNNIVAVENALWHGLNKEYRKEKYGC